MDEYESLSHSKWECKISCCFHSEVPQKDTLRGVETAPRGGVSQAGATKGKQDRRRPPDAGSRSHDDFDSAEICGLAGGRVYQGQSAIHLARVYGEKKRNFVGQHFWAREGTSSRPSVETKR